MTGIHQDVDGNHLRNYPEEREIIHPFSKLFHVTWARRRTAYNTDVSVYFLRPERGVKDAFGIEREIFLCVSGHTTMQARTMQAIRQIIEEEPAKGRVDSSVYFIASADRNVRTWVESYSFENPQSHIAVAFSFDEIRGLTQSNSSVLQLIGQQLFYRDLFDNQLPVNNELYFFGRDALCADFIDAVRKSQNRGLFGLRKSGKTSLLYKTRRLLEETETASVLFYDCKLPFIRDLSADKLLLKIISDIEKKLKTTFGSSIKELHVSEAFVQVCSSISRKKPLCIIFDEIEYISPLAIKNPHWREDFIPFWQTLWAAQSEIGKVSFIIAGVNPTVVEIDSFDLVQNPMFGIIKPTYLKGLEIEALKKMVSFFGSRMGLHFDDSALSNLYDRYGGHPLLSRMACSYVHSQIAFNKISRPTAISIKELIEGEKSRDAELTFYCRHIVSELKGFYPDEYEMLEMLAGSNFIDFMGLSEHQDFVRHIKEYGLVRFNSSNKPEFAIPVVGRYIASERARRSGTPLRRDIIPLSGRDTWLDRRKSSILNEIRSLQSVLHKGGLAQLFLSDSPAETEKFWDIKVVTGEEEFSVFINTMNRCFVEAIEKYGNKISKKDYFFKEIKQTVPELWSALYRIKIYRHSCDHLQLNETTQEALNSIITSDLEGKSSPNEVQSGWFVLQQITLDELLLGVQCGLNLYT
jgi:hypothetical protein